MFWIANVFSLYKMRPFIFITMKCICKWSQSHNREAEMYRTIFGFLINENIQVDIRNRRIIRFTTDNIGRSYYLNVSVTVIKEQSMFLLAYLLANGRDKLVRRDDILRNVWDERNLKSSSQILWSALKELRTELKLLGFDDGFIKSEKGGLYSINARKIQALHIKP